MKDKLNFCNAAVFYDYTNDGIASELKEARKCITNSFYKTIPHRRILVCLFIIVDLIFKNHNNDIENIIENIHDSRENVIYMTSFEKLIKDEQKVVKAISNDNDDE